MTTLLFSFFIFLLNNTKQGSPLPQVVHCRDKHKHCLAWANQGECNKDWMRQNCENSCNICGYAIPEGPPKARHPGGPTSPTGTPIEPPIGPSGLPETCLDQSPLCYYWAGNGQCAKNSLWMKVNCPEACNTCSLPESTYKPSTMQPTQPTKTTLMGCTDKSIHCGYWGGNSECTKNPYWMKINCPKTCKSCGSSIGTIEKPSPVPGCIDNDPNCPYWETVGECTKNSVWMEKNCKLSCKEC